MSQLPFDGSSPYRILPLNDLYAPVTTVGPYTHHSWIGFHPSVKKPEDLPLDLTSKPRKPTRKNNRKRKNPAPPPVIPKPKTPLVPPVSVWPPAGFFRTQFLSLALNQSAASPVNLDSLPGPMSLLPTGSPTTVAHMLHLVRKISYTQKPTVEVMGSNGYLSGARGMEALPGVHSTGTTRAKRGMIKI
ncbi:hypothetical protein L5515_015503 [Caenorhabditis briggsae]|uniref:Uncharacterized protein n=1 Tax=Caenorhabditis briggsae TaxID=6238 RepID=A0AAE9EG20_CAEBR|nr:hypothetical protein L5515_015503 [Caenorhabditis briggsae]